jgi:hypothetical protein
MVISWLNHDPIGERGGVNLYVFAGNNPINRLDIFGLCTEAIGKNGKPRIIFTQLNSKWHITSMNFKDEYVGLHSGGMIYGVSAEWKADVTVLCSCPCGMRQGTRVFEESAVPTVGLAGWSAYDLANVPIGMPGITIVTAVTKGLGELLAAGASDAIQNGTFILAPTDMNNILDQIKAGKPTDPTQGDWEGGVSPCSKSLSANSANSAKTD